MADPTDFLDLPTAQSLEPKARKDLDIPKWITAFRVAVKLEGASEIVEFPPELRQVVIERSYVRQSGRCFRIDDFAIFDYRARYRTGTAVFRLSVDKAAVRRAIQQAVALEALLNKDAIFDSQDPTSGIIGDVGDLVARFARVFKEIPVLEIFGDLADAIDLTALVEKLDKIDDRTKEYLFELKRLLENDGQIIKREPNVRQLLSLERVKTFSAQALIEVECADFILALPEGEASRVPEQDDVFYPGPKLKLKDRGGGRRESRAPRPLPVKALKAIRAALPAMRPPGPLPVPREIGRVSESASPKRRRNVTAKGARKRKG